MTKKTKVTQHGQNNQRDVKWPMKTHYDKVPQASEDDHKEAQKDNNETDWTQYFTTKVEQMGQKNILWTERDTIWAKNTHYTHNISIHEKSVKITITSVALGKKVGEMLGPFVYNLHHHTTWKVS